MGMTQNQLLLIGAIAENKCEDVKRYAIDCCREDSTKKNEIYIKKYIELLEKDPLIIGSFALEPKKSCCSEDIFKIEAPEAFQINKYYLSEENQLFQEQIINIYNANSKLAELNIAYPNTILLTGKRGVGKTSLAKYIAHTLNLPFVNIDFLYLINMSMDKILLNLKKVFDFAKDNKCVLMLDNIEYISQKKKALNELIINKIIDIVAFLSQEIPCIENGSILMASTGDSMSLDLTIRKIFAVNYELKPFSLIENTKMIYKFLDSTGLIYKKEDVESFVNNMVERLPQAAIIKYITSKIADSIINKRDFIELL